MVTDLDRVAAVLKGAQSYIDVFGVCPGDSSAQKQHVKSAYRTLARMIHPDNFNGTDLVDLASDAFATLETLKRQALDAVTQGTYGELPGTRIETNKWVHQVSITVDGGDIADMLKTVSTSMRGVERLSLCKLVRSPRDNDLLENEARALKQLRQKGSNPDFHPFFPELIESLRLKSGKISRRANVINRLEGFYSVSQLMEAFPNGLDPLHVAWIWRRILYALGYAHDYGVIHGALVAPHIMVHPEEHGVVLIDWAYASVELSGGYQPPLKAIPPSYKQWYPQEVIDKQSPLPGMDIQMAAQTMVQLMGANPLTLEGYPDGVPTEMRQYFKTVIKQARSATTRRAFEELDEFDRLLERLGGPYHPRRFRVLRMPSGVR